MTLDHYESLPDGNTWGETMPVHFPFPSIEVAVETQSLGIETRLATFLQTPEHAEKAKHLTSPREVRVFSADAIHDFLSQEEIKQRTEGQLPVILRPKGEARTLIENTAVDIKAAIIPIGMVKRNLKTYYKGIFERPASEAQVRAMNERILEYCGDRFPEVRLAQNLELKFKTSGYRTMEVASKDLLTAYGMSLSTLVRAPAVTGIRKVIR